MTLTRAVWVQQHEVTQALWTSQGLPNPSGPFPDGSGGDCTDDAQCPVGNLTWFEAVSFANTLSEAHDPPLPACYQLPAARRQGQVCAARACP